MLIGLQIKHFPLLIWTLLIGSDKINGSLSDARKTTNILEKIIKSNTESNHLTNVKRSLATNEDIVLLPEIENAIKLKVKELKPMLQDKDYNLKIRRRNYFKTEESEETVIIENVPENKRRANIKSAYKPTELTVQSTTDTSQKNIKYYKHLRQNITKLLDKVNTVNSTKKLITRTFDKMLALLIEQQCKRKSRNTTALVNHLVKDTRKSMPELTNIVEMMLKQDSVVRVLEFQDKTGNISEIRDEIIPQLQLPMTELLKKYKLKCYFDHKQNPGAKNEGPASGIRFRATSSEKNEQCDSFIVCSNELTHFLKITYNSLKNTVISSYRNYTDLVKKVATEKNETAKDILTSELKASNKITEKECNKIFIKQLKLFTLDKKKSKIANILHINDFLKVLGEKTIKSNTGLVLNDHELCNFFLLCNGQNMKKTNGTRKFYFDKHQKFTPKHYKNVYVKVEHSLNDELEESVPFFGEPILNQRKMVSQLDKSVTKAIDQKKYSHVNVTRTTLRSTATVEGPGNAEIESTEYIL